MLRDAIHLVAERPAAEALEHPAIRKIKLEHPALPAFAAQGNPALAERHEILCGGEIRIYPAHGGVWAAPPHNLTRHISAVMWRAT